VTNKKKEMIDSIGVHSIQYINPNYETTKKVKPPPQQQLLLQDKSNPTQFDEIYLHHGFVSMGYVLSQEVWSRRGGERTTRLLIDYALQNKMIISPTNTN
jgi:RimJ/RimL family protein N-acetyltransferase